MTSPSPKHHNLSKQEDIIAMNTARYKKITWNEERLPMCSAFEYKTPVFKGVTVFQRFVATDKGKMDLLLTFLN